MPHPLTQIEIIHQLTEVGFTQKQAETQAQIITEVHEHTLATKDDLRKLETKMDNEFMMVKKEFSLVKKEIELLESKITSKITIIMGSLLGLFALVQKFLLA